jgi:hypothetical protein
LLDFLTEPPAEAHAKIVAIHHYWQKAAPGAGLLPGRQHIDPLDIPKLLDHVWMVDVVGEPKRFRIRLIGGQVGRPGSSVKRGDFVDEFLDATGKEMVLGHLLACATSGKPVWYRGKGFLPRSREAFELERIFLPLAEDGRVVGILLCLTVYYTSAGQDY